jgi:hypothetical protein
VGIQSHRVDWMLALEILLAEGLSPDVPHLDDLVFSSRPQHGRLRGGVECLQRKNFNSLQEHVFPPRDAIRVILHSSKRLVGFSTSRRISSRRVQVSVRGRLRVGF